MKSLVMIHGNSVTIRVAHNPNHIELVTEGAYTEMTPDMARELARTLDAVATIVEPQESKVE